MDYAVLYNKTAVTLGQINQVRLYKKVLLPCEVISFDGHAPTRFFYNQDEESPLAWKFFKRT